VKHYRPFYDSFLFKEPRKSAIPLFKFISIKLHRSKKEERGRSSIECLKKTGVKWWRLKEKKLSSSSRKSLSDIWSWKEYKSKEKKLYAERKWKRKKRELMS
jgi:hypothetical protein